MIAFLAALSGLGTSLCSADDILFQDQKGPQAGVILQEDDKTVTIRFPRQSIRSMNRDKTSPTVSTDNRTEHSHATDLNSKVGDLQERMDRIENRLHNLENRQVSSIPESSFSQTITEQILSEELGRVEGVISWRGHPVDHGNVKIVLTNYTGFSPGSLRKIFPPDPEASSSRHEMTLSTKTDSQGRYVYDRVPPGQYMLYWQPDENTGWVRRLREEPDFEVIAGKLVRLDIPEKKR